MNDKSPEGSVILKDWLKGTDCHKDRIKRSILFENNDYIVLKHNSHSCYSGQMLGSGCCYAYAELYKKAQLILRPGEMYNHNLYYGYGAGKRWEGRIDKSTVMNDCKVMGINFD